MDFDLSKAQKLLQQSARDFFARECKPERVRKLMATETAFDAELWQAMQCFLKIGKTSFSKSTVVSRLISAMAIGF